MTERNLHDHLWIYTLIKDASDWETFRSDSSRWYFDEQCSDPVPADVVEGDYSPTIYTEWGWEGAGRTVTPLAFPTLVHRSYI